MNRKYNITPADYLILVGLGVNVAVIGFLLAVYFNS